MAAIDSIDALEAVVGKQPPAVNLKVIDHIDAMAQRWLASSPLMFTGVGEGEAIAITLAGGPAGFARADANMLALPLDLIDDPGLLQPSASFSSLFLLPGVGETLRVNGRVAGAEDGMARIAVDECYGHCAKALIRSDFWHATPVETAPDTIGDFIGATSFIALATVGADGGADLSPKGDPAGAMARLDEGRLCFPDRPGNRRTDSFRNIIAQPRIAAALLQPGSCQVAILTGSAALTSDEDARAPFTVQDKTPLLVTRVDEPQIALRKSPALERARLWPAADAPADIKPAKMFAEHVRLNRDKGLGARIASAAVSIPGLMQRALDKDYKDNLY